MIDCSRNPRVHDTTVEKWCYIEKDKYSLPVLFDAILSYGRAFTPWLHACLIGYQHLHPWLHCIYSMISISFPPYISRLWVRQIEVYKTCRQRQWSKLQLSLTMCQYIMIKADQASSALNDEDATWILNLLLLLSKEEIIAGSSSLQISARIPINTGINNEKAIILWGRMRDECS